MFSSQIIIRAAKVPDSPSNVATVLDISTERVTVSWTAPYDGGSTILSYTVVLMRSDGVTFSEMAECDGKTTAVIAS